MEHSELINEVYSKLCEKFLENISDADKERCKEAYAKYLHDYYDTYFAEASDDSINGVVNMCLSREKITNLAKSADAKIAFLFPDKVYQELEKLSFEISAIAADKRKGKEIEILKSKEEYVSGLKELFEKVSDLFKYSAERVYSEALADLEFIFGDGSISSFRNSAYFS